MSDRKKLQTFKIIKRLQTALTYVMGFAGGAAELTDHSGISAVAVGAGNGPGFAEEGVFVGGTGQGWRDAVRFEFLLAVFTHPVGGPGGMEDGLHGDLLVTGVLERGF